MKYFSKSLVLVIKAAVSNTESEQEQWFTVFDEEKQRRWGGGRALQVSGFSLAARAPAFANWSAASLNSFDTPGFQDRKDCRFIAKTKTTQ